VRIHSAAAKPQTVQKYGKAKLQRHGGFAQVRIPLPELSQRLAEIPKTAPVVLCCASGTRSGMSKRVLKKNGYRDVYNIGNWTKFLN
jgi:rhodanese-related sulfurtransferase